MIRSAMVVEVDVKGFEPLGSHARGLRRRGEREGGRELAARRGGGTEAEEDLRGERRVVVRAPARRTVLHMHLPHTEAVAHRPALDVLARGLERRAT